MLQIHRFLTPPEQENKAGVFLELLVLCFFCLTNILIVYFFISGRLSGQTRVDYLLTAAYLVAVLLGCGIIMWINIRPVYILLAIIVLSLAVRLWCIAVIPTRPTSDFSKLYEAAQAAAAGDFSWAHVTEGYFFRWAYQIPFVLYEAVILWAFRSIWALKAFNVLFMVGTNYLLYCIGKQFLSDRASLCLAFIYAVFPGAVIYTPVLTNQHVSLFFLLLGVWILLRSDPWWMLFPAGLSLAVSDLMRPEAIVILAAVFSCGLLRYIQHPSIKTLKRMAAAVVLVFGSYWITKNLTGLALALSDIAPNGIGSQIPEWKFVLGLGNIEGYGAYSEADIAILYMENAADRHAMLAEIMGNFLRLPPVEKLRFFMGKIDRFWTSPQDLEWSLWNLENSMELLPGLTVQGFRACMRCFERGMLLLVYLLALPAPALLWRERRKNGAALFCLAVVCLIFCAYLLVEIQPRYRYFAVPFWLLTGGVSIEWLMRRCRPGGELSPALRRDGRPGK